MAGHALGTPSSLPTNRSPMSLKINLESIQSSLEQIESDMDGQLDTLEGEAPDHMNFSRLRDAQKDVKEQAELLRKWISNFSIGDINQNTY